VVHAYNPSTQDAEAGKKQVQGQAGLHSEFKFFLITTFDFPNAYTGLNSSGESLTHTPLPPQMHFYHLHVNTYLVAMHTEI
jgi:hypothetical protein